MRLIDDANASELEKMQDGGEADVEMKNPVALLTKYEKDAADLANNFEETTNRFT